MTPRELAPSRRFAMALVAGGSIFLALDAAWLGLMGERLYRPAIGHLMRAGFDVLPAAVFYVVYLAGSTALAVLPAASASGAAWRGALFGFVAYATYDLTNQATLRDWPWHVTLLDLAWGTFATATSATVAWTAVRRRARGRA